MLTLENEWLKVAINPHGAELKSLFYKPDASEKMWSGDPDFWAKKSPVLFPIVGALKEDSYFFEGKKYSLPRHGFAREKTFELETINTNEAVFTLQESEATLKIYPFKFKLSLRYAIVGSTLTCAYEIENPDNKPLLFSVGAHPAFATPTNANKKYEDYALLFNKDEQLNVHKIVNNLISDSVETIALHDMKLPLNYPLFYDDALVLKDLKSDIITLNTGIRFRFEGFPYFGIWAAKDADFVCLEPWCGIADSVHSTQQLAEKEGIITLPAKETWKRQWMVECF